MNTARGSKSVTVGRLAWKRIATGVATSVTVAALVSGCGLFPSGGSILGSSGNANVTANPVPKYVASDFITNARYSRSWLHTDAAKKAVTLSVVLNANELSLNGYSHGFAEVDVPVGWHVTVNFTNKNNVLPGSLMLVQPSALVSAKYVSAAIRGASTKLPYQGIGLDQSQSFSFVANKPANYVLWSAPTGSSGTWMWFRVIPSISSPGVKVKHVTA